MTWHSERGASLAPAKDEGIALGMAGIRGMQQQRLDETGGAPEPHQAICSCLQCLV